MTATDELRRLLDERGIEYYPKAADETVFSTGTEHVHVQDDLIDGCLELFIRPVTPQQAVEATLGSDLQAENAKLRELVRDMWRTFMSGKTTAAQRAELRKRLGELGMEVDA